MKIMNGAFDIELYLAIWTIGRLLDYSWILLVKNQDYLGKK